MRDEFSSITICLQFVHDAVNQKYPGQHQWLRSSHSRSMHIMSRSKPKLVLNSQCDYQIISHTLETHFTIFILALWKPCEIHIWHMMTEKRASPFPLRFCCFLWLLEMYGKTQKNYEAWDISLLFCFLVNTVLYKETEEYILALIFTLSGFSIA